MVLEVDSPVHSPAAKPRSPSPNDDRASGEKDVEDGCDENDFEPHRRKEQRFEDPPSKEYVDAPEITHCHHNGGSQIHYTMRPPQDYYQSPSDVNFISSSLEYSHVRQHHSIVTRIPESYLPTLHVRRDLHHKGSMPPTISATTSTVTKTVISLDQTPNFLGSMPFRKRSSAGFIRDQREVAYTNHHLLQQQQQQEKMNPLNLSSSSNHHQPTSHHLGKSCSEQRHILKSSDSMPLHSPSQSSEEPPPALVVATAPSVLNHQAQSSAQSQTNRQPARPSTAAGAQQQPRRRTGFSIEDIMRR